MRNNRPRKSARTLGRDKPSRAVGADKPTHAERAPSSSREHIGEHTPRPLDREKPRRRGPGIRAEAVNPNEMRLNKFLAESGVASRRGADEMITEGLVTVNGKKVYELGTRVNVKIDKVLVDGKPVRQEIRKLYILFNKPKGVMTTMEDPEGRPCIAEYFTNLEQRVYPVGRLDYDSEGLLLMTNDGEFAQRVTHPKHEVFKTYLVKVNGQPTEEHLRKLRTGVTIIGGRVAAREVEKLRGTSSDKYDWFKIVIGEGKNRQVRRMFEKIGFDVMKLQRIAIGKLKMGGLARGEWSMLTLEEVEKIFASDADSHEGRNRPVPRSDGTLPDKKRMYKERNRPKSAKALARDESSRSSANRGKTARRSTRS
jgi:23S rRNA pseudouridine2605 synthase